MKLNIQLFADGKVIIGTELDTSGFEDGLDDLDKQSKLSKVLTKLKSKFSQIGSSISSSIKKAGTGIAGLVKKVASVGSIIVKTMAKIVTSAVGFGVALVAALGIIAVLSVALLAVGEAFKQVGEKNKTLKNDIQYIIFALKTALKPVIDAIANVIVKIISFIVTILKYAMAIANLIAGRNLFEKATPEAFAKYMKDAEKSSKKTAGHAKEIKKQLAGFDEMNVLTDNRSSGGGASIKPTDYSTSFDLTDLSSFESKIKETWDKIKTKVVDAWNFINKTSRDEAKKLIDQTDSDFKLMHLGFFDMLHGISLFIEGIYDYWSGVFDFIVGLFTGNEEKITKGVSKMKDGIIKILKGIVSFVIGIPETIMGIAKGIGTKLGKYFKEKIDKRIESIKKIPQTIKDAFKDGFWTGLLNLIKKGLNKIIDKLNDKFTISVGKTLSAILKGLGINVEKGTYHLISIPRLAKGGIINNPGKGVAIGGEKGQEGVIPLTDSQQMELLGEAIGRHINLTATIPVYAYNRQVAREVRKIEMQDAFAMNR